MSVPVPNVLNWPLGGIDENGRLSYTRDDDSVREVIRNILLTRPGERLMRPQFGAGIMDFIHQPNNETTRTLMANLIRKAIEQWETRIKVESVRVVPDGANVSVVQIIIRYHLRHTRTPQQLTLGLALDQG